MCLRSLQTAVIAAEALTVYKVVIVLTVVWDVKGFVIILDGLLLLVIFWLIVHCQAISFTCIRNAAWVCVRGLLYKFVEFTLKHLLDSNNLLKCYIYICHIQSPLFILPKISFFMQNRSKFIGYRIIFEFVHLEF